MCAASATWYVTLVRRCLLGLAEGPAASVPRLGIVQLNWWGLGVVGWIHPTKEVISVILCEMVPRSCPRFYDPDREYTGQATSEAP